MKKGFHVAATTSSATYNLYMYVYAWYSYIPKALDNDNILHINNKERI